MAVKKANPKIIVESINLSNTPRDSFALSKELITGLINKSNNKDKIRHARVLTYFIVKSYWQSIYTDTTNFELPNLYSDLGKLDIDSSLFELADVLGKAASKLDFIDASYQIGCIYTAILPKEYRSTNGIYFTPPALTYRMIAMAEDAGVDWMNAKILDPACGGGAFLAPVALRIASAFKDLDSEKVLTHIEEHLIGFEIDSFSAWLSQVFVEVALNKICKSKKRRIKPLIKICNTLKLHTVEKFDLIIGNPPYGKIKLNKTERLKFKDGLYGHANLYGLFTQFAISNLNENGVIAFVTPTSFTSGEYFKNLRSLICAKSTPLEFDFVLCRKGIFEDVLQETMLGTYKHGVSEPIRPIKLNEIHTYTGNKIDVREIGEFLLPVEKSAPWLLPRNLEQSILIQKLNTFTNRLSDWGYTVKTGPLVWNRHKDQLKVKLTDHSFPLIWAEAIANDGRFAWKADKKNHTLYFKIKKGNDWLLTDYPCILMQRTTAKEQQKRLITTILPQEFIDTHKYVVIENHINIIKSTSATSKVSLQALNAFLTSKATDNVFRCFSGSVAVSAYELEQLPLPSHSSLANLEALIQSDAPTSEIEKECFRIYNM
jgi:adenine-specific DNA-methyltransferase